MPLLLICLAAGLCWIVLFVYPVALALALISVVKGKKNKAFEDFKRSFTF